MDSNDKKTEVFLSLLVASQRKINAYILSVVPNFSDADDIMQETISVMWKKFDHFEIGSDFAGWGVKVAYYCVLNHRKQKSKDASVLNDNIFRQINDVAQQRQNETDDRIRHLRRCIEKLNSDDQRFLKARYELNNSAKSLSVQMDRSVQYVYKHLSRIHHLLNNCVKRAVREQEAV
ncbi:MAG: sigma-70 family RNA polymerase sigma factor [Planctomycetaceae bacterium]|nr:sigma-70 family RNA polymerase sigma factor [Planctomycetaceae bacterium]